MSIYNQDELVPPSWINQEFFEEVLQEYENNKSLKVTHVEISPASLKGDHYASVTFKCKVTYECDSCSQSQQKQLILKTLPTEAGPKLDLLKESSVFETEIAMYTEALSKIEEVLSKCGECIKLAADIIYHYLEPHKVIILEDLYESGYNVIRERYLTEHEIKIVYRKIAKFHAASFVLANREGGECMTKFEKGLYSSTAIMNMGFMTAGIVNFMDMLSKDDVLNVYLVNVKTMQTEMVEKCKNMYQAYKLNKDCNDIFVLNHALFLLSKFLPHIPTFLVKSANELKDVDTAQYVENPEMGTVAYQQQGYIDEMRRLLPVLLMEGYLD